MYEKRNQEMCIRDRYAPMGDPVELQIHGYELTLRLADACICNSTRCV